MEIVYHGHSTIQVTDNGKSFIIDPFLSDNPVAKVKAQDIHVQHILLTHGHSDHVADAAEIAKNNDATIVGTYELATFYSWQGLKAHPMNLGGTWNFDFGSVTLTQAFHSSAMTYDDEQKIVYLGMPAGLVIRVGDKTIYHAGDTALFSDMKLIGELYNIDIAFLPIGDNFTMGPQEALIAAEWVKAKTVVPIHYNTFGLIKQDGHAFVQKLKDKGINGLVVEPGESFNL
jgi:L-ascorbate metabolism protein UlaG (beta-lactamase superfamily)